MGIIGIHQYILILLREPVSQKARVELIHLKYNIKYVLYPGSIYPTIYIYLFNPLEENRGFPLKSTRYLLYYADPSKLMHYSNNYYNTSNISSN